MRILIKNGAAETVLCDGSPRGLNKNVGPLGGLSIDDQVNVQIREFIRAAYAKPTNRKNKKTQVSFSVSRECASLTEAHSWQMNFHISCVREGTVYFIETTGGGATTTYQLKDAVLQFKTLPVGVSRTIQFLCIGGELSA